MALKLTDLNPRWVGAGGEGIHNADGSPAEARHGVGLSFDCPCGSDICTRAFVPFDNPLDGKPAIPGHEGHTWQRVGETFETLTLSPSIQRVPMNCNCAWHGFIKNGEVTVA
jgi:hypothetical protein